MPNIDSLDSVLAKAYAEAKAAHDNFALPDEAAAADDQQLEPALFRLLERIAAADRRVDDIAEVIWQRFGVAALEKLLAHPAEYRHFYQSLGPYLDACWDAAKPILARALLRGGPADLALSTSMYVTSEQLGELLADCEPALTFSKHALAAWPSALGECNHPAASALLAKLRNHRSRLVRVNAAISDPLFRTPENIAALIDSFTSKDDTSDLSSFANYSHALDAPEIQAAAVRLLARSRESVSGPKAMTMHMHAIIELIRTPSPALEDWVRTARADPELHTALIQILKKIRLPGDDEMLHEIARGLEVGDARAAKLLLHERGAGFGPFIDIIGWRPSLVPDRMSLSVATSPSDSYPAPPSHKAVIELALRDPNRLGVSFSHQDVTWCAILAQRGFDFTCIDVVQLSEIVETNAEDARTRLKRAHCGRLRAEAAIKDVTLAEYKSVLDAAEPVRAPEVLVRAVDRLSEIGAHEPAMRVNLRLQKILEMFEGFCQEYTVRNLLRDAQRQLFRVAMDGGRFDYALNVGHSIGPLPATRALVALGRFEEALVLIDQMGITDEIIALQRECLAQVARAKAARTPAAGDAVTHPKFGAGTIVKLDGDKARIKFSDAERLLALKFVTRSSAA